MIDNLIPQKVQNIEEYRPNLIACKVRLDANESPFLPSKAVLDELANALYSLDFNRYPDPYATELIKSFAEIYNVNPDNVVAGNGSDELISLIASGLTDTGDGVTVLLPDFSMYEFYSTLAGARSVRYIKNENFDVDFTALLAKAKENSPKLVIFSNPCNPTGWVCKKADVEAFIAASDSIVVVDEAYMEFSAEDESVIPLIDKYDNLIVLKTMSKAFGAAALRLGFAITSCQLATALRKIKSPYNVNTVSQVFGNIILSHYGEIRENVKLMRENLVFMKSELEKISSDKIVKICPTAANFVYIEMSSPDVAREIWNKLMARGVAIRCMSDGHLRICAGTKEETETFLREFKEVLK